MGVGLVSVAPVIIHPVLSANLKTTNNNSSSCLVEALTTSIAERLAPSLQAVLRHKEDDQVPSVEKKAHGSRVTVTVFEKIKPSANLRETEKNVNVNRKQNKNPTIMGVERIDGSHPLRSQFTTFQKQHPSKAIIQEFRPSPPLSPLATATAATTAAAMVHITSMTTTTPRRRGGVLSLKDIMQRPSLSPSSTAATDVIYKTNTNGLWLEFPVAARRSNTNATTADRNAIMEESRDQPEIRDSSSIATKHEEETRFLSNHLMEHPPQLFSLGARFHARTEGYLGDEIPMMDYMELHMEVPKIVSFDHNAAAVTLADAVMVANSDDSLFTNDEENNDDKDDDSDGWSFDTDPDASFESFEEISILTQETLDLEDIKMNETPVPTDTATVQEKKTSLDDFEEIKMNSFQMAIQDAALTNFLVDFCSPVVSSFKG